jgi:hypothetical protein
MKDAIVALTEALRLARLELECFRDPNCRASAEWTVKRLDELLNDRAVTAALAALAREIESPPLIPQGHVIETQDIPAQRKNVPYAR